MSVTPATAPDRAPRVQHDELSPNTAQPCDTLELLRSLPDWARNVQR